MYIAWTNLKEIAGPAAVGIGAAIIANELIAHPVEVVDEENESKSARLITGKTLLGAAVATAGFITMTETSIIEKSMNADMILLDHANEIEDNISEKLNEVIDEVNLLIDKVK